MSEQENYTKQYKDYLKFMEKNGLGNSTLNSLIHREFNKIPVMKREQILLAILSVLLALLIMQSYMLLNVM